MKNNPVVVMSWQSTPKQRLITHGCLRRRIVITILSAVFLSVSLAGQIAFADLQQVFVDGQAGRFVQVRSELQRLSEELEAQVTSADITIVGRNCAAIGFYSMLSQVASDCISNNIGSEYGKKLFTSAQKAASGQLDQAASLAKEVADANPKYPQAHLVLARILMGKCMQYNENCNEAINVYQQALGMDKALAVAYLDLGMLYQHMGKNQKAIEVWEGAVTQSQGHTAIKWAHLMLALLYSMEEQWVEAKKHAQKAKELGFTGFAAELLDEIQQHILSNSTSESQKPSEIEEKRDINAGKGFFNGLFATLKLIPIAVETIASFFKPGSEGTISMKLEALWNEGSDSYKAGFVVGILIIISLLGGGVVVSKKK